MREGEIIIEERTRGDEYWGELKCDGEKLVALMLIAIYIS